MNTRKANLKKLRLPTSGNSDSRNGRRKVTSTISNFFTPETNFAELPNEVDTTVYSEPMPSPIETVEPIKEDPLRRSSRTKLSAFLPKEKRIKPVEETRGKLDDFEAPEKNIKKAPKLKAKPRPKKQQKIKTAFLKNEELFSEVTAQHCLVDNINPDDMQLALALSRSVTDVNGAKVIDQDKNKEEQNGIREKLQKFGFRVAETEDYNLTVFKPTNKKAKWGNKFTALTLRNPKRQLEKVNQKVEEFLSTQFLSSTMVSDEPHCYIIKSEVLLPFVARGHRIIRPDTNYEREGVVDFYVLSLFEPSKTKLGYLLKNVRKIPGRDRSPIPIRYLNKGECCTDPQLQSPATKKSRFDDVLSHAGLSLPFPDTAKVFDYSSKPMHATIGSFSDYDVKIETNTTCSGTVSTAVNVESSKDSACSIKCAELHETSLSPQSNGIKPKTLGESMASSLPYHRPDHEDNESSITPISCNSLNVNYNSDTIEYKLESGPTSQTLVNLTDKSTPPTNSGGCLQSELSSIRSTSPDIFADSDVEMEEDDCNKMETLKVSNSSSSDHHILSYERFSSDDVKTFSDTITNDIKDLNHNSIDAIIDLTQCGSDNNSQLSDINILPALIQPHQDSIMADECLNTIEEKPLLSFSDCNKLMESKITSFSLSSSALDEFPESTSFDKSKTEDSIDLTQASDDEDDCILLSDDEVNYSIWKTNKSLDCKDNEEDEIEDVMGRNATHDHFFNKSAAKHEFSFVDLVTNTQPFPSQSGEFNLIGNSQSNESLDSLELDLSLGLGVHDKHSPFRTPRKSPKRTPTSTKCHRAASEFTAESNSSLDSLELELSKRSDFGILEEQSPFKTPTKTPKKSPTIKTTSTKCRRVLSESFIKSRVNESVVKHEFSFVGLDVKRFPSHSDEPNLNGKSQSNTSLDSLELDLAKRTGLAIQSPFKSAIPKKSPNTSPCPTKCQRSVSEYFNSSVGKHASSFVDLSTDAHLFPSHSDESNLNGKNKSNASLDSLELYLGKRSDSGVIKEHSPFKTPTKTPKKSPRTTPTSTKSRRAMSESFIASPMESSAPLKRFSTTNKFSEFTKSFDDNLDDIDKLIFGSPSKKVYKKPAGLDQLLTGVINNKIKSPQKLMPESPKEFEFNSRTYLVRTTNIAQKPNYEAMEESSLLDLLYRYGIRRLNRKQAIKILEYVYNQTHPCLIDEKDISPQTKTADRLEDEILNNDEETSSNRESLPSGVESTFNFKDCWGHLLVSDMDFATEIQDEQYIVQTNTSKKISTALLPFHIAWYNLVKSNKLLHEALLHYEPIDLQEVYLFFKALGYRYDPKELKYFFDSRSIIFRYDLNKPDPNGGASRHKRKKRPKVAKIN